jgi:hypothetical protein
MPKADAIGCLAAVILSACELRLDDFTALRLTAAHGQASFEEETGGGDGGRR